VLALRGGSVHRAHEIELLAVEHNRPTALKACNAYVPFMLVTDPRQLEQVDQGLPKRGHVPLHARFGLPDNLDAITAVPSLHKPKTEPVTIHTLVTFGCPLFPDTGVSDKKVGG